MEQVSVPSYRCAIHAGVFIVIIVYALAGSQCPWAGHYHGNHTASYSLLFWPAIFLWTAGPRQSSRLGNLADRTHGQRVCVSAHVLRESDGCREGRVIPWLHTESSPGSLLHMAQLLGSKLLPGRCGKSAYYCTTRDDQGGKTRSINREQTRLCQPQRWLVQQQSKSSLAALQAATCACSTVGAVIGT